MGRRLKLILAELLIGAATLICGSLFLGIGVINYMKVTVLPLFTRRKTRINTEKSRNSVLGKIRSKESCYE